MRLQAVICGIAEQTVEPVAVSVVEGVDDRLAVDRVLHRVPEFLHRERRMERLVEDDGVVDLGRSGDDPRVGVLLLAGDLVRRQVGEVNLTAVEGQQGGGRIRELAPNDPVELRPAVPVVLERGELDRLAGCEGRELEWPGAHRLARRPPVVALGDLLHWDLTERCLVDDRDDRQRVEHRRVRRVGGDRDRQGIGRGKPADRRRRAVLVRLGAGDPADAGAVGAADLGVVADREREDDVVGREVRAVMPLHARPEVERPRQAVRTRLPRRGQEGDEIAVAVGLRVDRIRDQRLVDVHVVVLLPDRPADRVRVVDARAAGTDPRAGEGAALGSVLERVAGQLAHAGTR